MVPCSRVWRRSFCFFAAQYPCLAYASPTSNSSAIVVLGQSMRPDGTPADTLIFRSKETAALYRQMAVARVVPTGGDPAGVGTSEADSMRQLLLKEGVPTSHIILENKSQNTVQNALFVRPILRDLGAGKMILVTSDFHMPRASYIFEAVLKDEIEILPHPVHGGCPSIDADEGANVNDKSLRQRLKGELHWIHRDMQLSFLQSGLPNTHIPVPSMNRFRHALYEVNELLVANERSERSQVDVEPPVVVIAKPTLIVCSVVACGIGLLLGCISHRWTGTPSAYGQLDDTKVVGDAVCTRSIGASHVE